MAYKRIHIRKPKEQNNLRDKVQIRSLEFQSFRFLIQVRKNRRNPKI